MDALAAFENHAFSEQNLCNGYTGCNHSSRLPRGVAEVERDHAHTTFYIAPHSGHQTEPASSMERANRRSPRVEGARIRPDPSLSKVRRLQPLIQQLPIHDFSRLLFKKPSPCFFVAAEPFI